MICIKTASKFNPTKCRECRMSKSNNYLSAPNTITCDLTGHEIESIESKPYWCPIIEIEEQNEWISAEDYLPPVGQSVLVQTYDGRTMITHVEIRDGKYVFVHPVLPTTISVEWWMDIPRKGENR